MIVRVPSKVLLIFSLLSSLSGLGHVGPVREGLEQTADVLIFRPGGADGQFLFTLDNAPGNGGHTTSDKNKTRNTQHFSVL